MPAWVVSETTELNAATAEHCRTTDRTCLDLAIHAHTSHAAALSEAQLKRRARRHRLSALGGFALTQLWQSRRETIARSYEHRREAHVQFLKTFNGYWNATAFHTMYSEGPASSDLDPAQFEALFNALLTAQVFASAQSYRAAVSARDHLMAYMKTDGMEHLDDLQAAFDICVRAVRKELRVK
ncbi:hypothetical protein ACWEPL_15495 [Nonomuraea sp. NPDC004186]